MQDVFDFLMVGSSQNARIRITSLYYDAINDRYVRIFSVSPFDRVTAYTEQDLQTLKPRIPVMNDRDSVVIVETLIDYTPPFNTGIFNITQALGSQVFDEFVVTPPRFRTAICLQDPGCPAGI